MIKALKQYNMEYLRLTEIIFMKTLSKSTF